MRTRMVSAWTVALAYHTFRQLAEVFRQAAEPGRLARLEALLARMRGDFAGRLMPGSVVAGFVVADPDGTLRPLLHPSDAVTGIRYRLLPMTRSILAELFTAEEAARHMSLVTRELLYPDGVRLMSEPATYHGGLEHLFRRAETAANVGREIGLQYVHAHLRYAEAMAKLGDAERLWTALQVVNPVGIGEVVANALPRQSNVYFSSSDADFHDRVEAARRWEELRTGSVRLRGGWRLYSSGPGTVSSRGARLPARASGNRSATWSSTPCCRAASTGSRPARPCATGPWRCAIRRWPLLRPERGDRERDGAHRRASGSANPYRAGGLRFQEDALQGPSLGRRQRDCRRALTPGAPRGRPGAFSAAALPRELDLHGRSRRAVGRHPDVEGAGLDRDIHVGVPKRELLPAEPELQVPAFAWGKAHALESPSVP